jgi:hypothetical protein
VGGGLELALACNLRTACDTARLGLPEVSLGIIPGYAARSASSRVAGRRVAREWILTGDQFTAEEGLPGRRRERFVPHAELRSGTVKLVQTILSLGPVAVRFAIEAIQRGSTSRSARRDAGVRTCSVWRPRPRTMRRGHGRVPREAQARVPRGGESPARNPTAATLIKTAKDQSMKEHRHRRRRAHSHVRVLGHAAVSGSSRTCRRSTSALTRRGRRSSVRRIDPETIQHVVFANVVQSSPDAITARAHVGLKAGTPQAVPA